MTVTVLLFWIYFLLTLVFALQWLSFDFPSNSQWDAPFHCIAYDYSPADWDSLLDHLRDFPWEDILNSVRLLVAGEFREWVQVGIDVYIPHCKHQVKPHSSP